MERKWYQVDSSDVARYSLAAFALVAAVAVVDNIRHSAITDQSADINSQVGKVLADLADGVATPPKVPAALSKKVTQQKPEQPASPPPPPEYEKLDNRQLMACVRNGDIEAYRHLDMRFYNSGWGADVKDAFLQLGFSDAEYEAVHNAVALLYGWEIIHSEEGSGSHFGMDNTDQAMYQVYQGIMKSAPYHFDPLFRKLVPEIRDIVDNLIPMYSSNDGARDARIIRDLKMVQKRLR